MSRGTIVLHSPLSPSQFEARFTEQVEPDGLWAHGPLIWFADGKSVVGQIDGGSFTLRRIAAFPRRRVPLLIFHGDFRPDPNGGTCIEGHFSLFLFPVVVARIIGIGAGMVLLVETVRAWGQFGILHGADRIPVLLAPLALVGYGVLYPIIARLLAGGSEAFLLDFLRKNLLAQVDQADDLPVLDSMMR